MKSEIISKQPEKVEKPFPKLMIDNDGMVVLRIDGDNCLTVNSGSSNNGSWEIFDRYNNWNFSRMKDFDGVIQLSND